jgi:hypothetical protein
MIFAQDLLPIVARDTLQLPVQKALIVTNCLRGGCDRSGRGGPGGGTPGPLQRRFDILFRA